MPTTTKKSKIKKAARPSAAKVTPRLAARLSGLHMPETSPLQNF